MKKLIVTLCYLILTQFVWSADWPKWLGPTGEGVWEEEGVVTTIPDEGLTTK